MNQIEIVPPMTNREFLEKYARPGRVGLAGGGGLIDRAIRQAERLVDPAQRASLWSHAMLFEGIRPDGHHWVIESDLEIHARHVRLGVQENRAAKYFDAAEYPELAILDFNLPPDLVTALLREGLDMVAGRIRYSIRELFGTLAAMRRPELRKQANPLASEKSIFCSAFVIHVFRAAGLDLAPGLDEKQTTPEDISRTPVPHATYLLRREPEPRPLREEIHDLRETAKARRRARVEKIKTRLAARKRSTQK